MLRTSIFLALFLCFGTILAVEDVCTEKRVQTGDGTICAGINAIRAILKEGIAGIPPLDPLNVTDIPLTFATDIISGNLHLQNLTLTGLSDFNVSETGNLITIHLPMHFNIVKLVTRYNGDLNLFGKLHIYGKGDIILDLQQLNVNIDFKIFGRQKLSVTLVDPLPKIETVFTGLLNDDFMSDIISEQFGDTVTTLISDHIDVINQFLDDIAQNLINSILAKNLVNKFTDKKELTPDDIKNIAKFILSEDIFSNILKNVLRY